MQCPQCGYIRGPFDAACPKCESLARTRPPAVPQNNVPPYVAAGRPQSPYAQGQTPIATGLAPNGQPYKVCPTCGQAAAMSMGLCGRCRFAFPVMLPVNAAGASYGNAQAVNAPAFVENPRYAPKDNSRLKQQAGIGAALLCLALLIGVPIMSRSSHSSRSGGSALVMLPNSNGKGNGSGGGLTGAVVDESQFNSRLTTSGATTGGEVEVSLAWNTLSDLDLEVRDPSGELISAYHPRSESGGMQDVDANPTLVTMEGSALLEAGKPCGPENITPLPEFMVDMDKKFNLPEGFGTSGSRDRQGRARSKFTRTPIEHIYYNQALKGTYTVYAHCYSWREPDARPLPCTVQVRSRGQAISAVNGTLGPASFVIEGVRPVQVCQFQIR